MTELQPVIMSGGSGTRLWPLSTEAAPKQFHALVTELTMIQDTCLRVATHESLKVLPPVVICNHRHGHIVAEQLGRLGQPPAGVILEPFGRNTAAVAVVAAAWARLNAPDAVVLLLPADHLVLDAEGFRTAIAVAMAAVRDHVVTFGIAPTGPETGYGYIQGGAPLYEGVFAVKRFVEKPDRATALSYLADGGYSWNAGIFLFRPDLLLGEAQRHCPGIRAESLAALEAADRDGVFATLNPDAFARCPSDSIDIAIMEKTDKAAVVPCDIGWADVGSWSELWRHGPKDARENVHRGEVIALDTQGSILWSDGPTIAAVGVKDLIIIAAGGQVLVLPKDRAQDVKRVVEALKAKAP